MNDSRTKFTIIRCIAYHKNNPPIKHYKQFNKHTTLMNEPTLYTQIGSNHFESSLASYLDLLLWIL